MPCVLVETAFLSHAIEGKYLGTSTYQETLAEGLFQGIARFLQDDAAGDL
jgi:N-acetylmuramoyl-L-alanine amidase